MSGPGGPPRNAEWVARDLAVVWHPCTQMKEHERDLPLVPIRRAAGAWLEDFDGRRYLDGISSWWVNLLGHADPRLDAALRTQLGTLEHVILAGFSHPPAVELAERLLAIAPPGLARATYADSGSAAVEIALKMSFHWWRNQGHQRKTKFVALTNSYHGETLGALGVGDVALYKETYAPLLLEGLLAPSPDAYLAAPGERPADCAARAAAALEALLARHADQVCALIVEPRVQCAGGMRMHDPSYLALARAACDRHGVHLIADEIAVGFGRTGTMFACEQAGIAPDFLLLGKGLTGGYLPLSVVLATDQVYQAFYADYPSLRGFLHSHSYTGNALACRVALATLDALAADGTVERNRERARLLGEALAPLADHPQVAEVRQAGMIVAVETVRDRATRTPHDWRERRALRGYREALSRGALIRPLAGVVYLMPPYCISADEIAALGGAARAAVDAMVGD
jgi:adenosylmethionine-8-amino-7-oxononanoate aminotransferase